MKNPSTELFDLIKSMTGSEKRYFKRRSNFHKLQSQNTYSKLFDAIDKQQVYEEETLKKEFDAKTFAVAKHYLYQQLLASLQQFHQEHQAEEQLRKLLYSFELLLDKNLISQAQKILIKAKKWIKANGLDTYQLILLQKQKQIWERNFFKSVTSTDLDHWMEQSQKSLKSMQEEFFFAEAHAQLTRLHYQKISIQQEDYQSLIYSYLESEFFQSVSPSSISAQIDQLRTRSIFHFMRSEPKEALKYNTKLLQLFEQHPFLIKNHPKRYLSLLQNYLIDNLQLRQFDALEQGLQRLQKLPSNKLFARIPHLEARVFERSTLLQLNMWMARGDFQIIQAESNNIKKGLKKYHREIALHNKLSYHYLIALANFQLDAHDKTQEWLQVFLQSSKKNQAEELFRFAHLLHLFVHFNLENHEFLHYQLLTYRRQFAPLYKAEELSFDVFRKLPTLSKKQKADFLKSKEEEYKEIRKISNQQRPFNYFDFRAWLKKLV